VVQVCFRADPALYRAVSEFARDAGVTRSEAIRLLLRLGLSVFEYANAVTVADALILAGVVPVEVARLLKWRW